MQDSSYVWQRVAATFIDYLIVFGLCAAVIIVFGTKVGTNSWVAAGLNFPFPFLLWFLYIVVVESVAQATLGHLLVGLKVIRMDGGKPNFRQVLVRRIFDFVDLSLTGGLLAFVLVLATDHYQRVGDLIAQTRVVGRKDFIQEIQFDFEGK
jgi:uncharacterized RDD family membrane protein YckC